MKVRIKNILVTGGAGFIGSEFVRQIAADGHKKIAVVDKLSYAGDLGRLKSVKDKIDFWKIDISVRTGLKNVIERFKPDVIVHFAAETHVDRSIQDNTPFIESNVRGTQNLVDLSLMHNVKQFIHISTDEVYGEHKKGRFVETDPVQPNNPYSATKAAAEFLVRAAIRTHQFPAIIVRPANNYGPWQYPEKLIPVIISKALQGQKIPVYGKGKQIREWLHVMDCARAICVIMNTGRMGETYNVGSYCEQENIRTVKAVLKVLGKPEDLIQFVKDRPGHDFRYSVDCSKLRKLGWRPQYQFDEGIKQTIQWYLNNLSWVEKKLVH